MKTSVLLVALGLLSVSGYCNERMLLSVFQEHIVNTARQRNISVGEAARLMRSWGVTGVDLWSGEQEETTDEILATGLKPATVVFFADFSHTNDQQAVDHAFAYAKRVGSPRIMLVPGFIKKGEDRDVGWEAMKPRLRAFLAQAKAVGLEVDCEDFDDKAAIVGSGVHLRQAFREFPELGHVLDTGNFQFWNEDVLAMTDEFLPRVRHVHVKDRDRQNPKISVGAGTGMMPIREVIEKLRKSDYRGYYTLECFAGSNTCKGVEISASYLRSIEASSPKQ